MGNLPLVGREQELTALKRWVTEAAAGSGRLVLIGGEAGVGKTTLVSRLMAEAPAGCSAVGRCPGAGETPPFGPWLEIIAGFQECGTEPLPSFSGPHVAHTARESANAMADWLAGLPRPQLFILEDIQWADPASLELLRHLATFLTRTGVVVIATYRSDELTQMHPLWSLLPHLQRDGAERLLLDRLDLHSVAALVSAVLSTSPEHAAEVAQALHARTGGHPLFVRELLLTIQRSGAIPYEEVPLPETVLQAIDMKLNRLAGDARSILSTAALIGERFAYDLLASVVECSEDALADVLEEAVSLHLIRTEGEGDTFLFDHALIREALLDRLIAPRRRRWHIRLAEALMRAPRPDPDAVAFHLSRADDPRAVEWLLTAGDRALRLGAVTQSRQMYERALQLLQGPDRRRGELLLKLGRTLRFGASDQAVAYWEEALHAAEESGDRPVAVWTRHMLLVEQRRFGYSGDLELMALLEAEQAELLQDQRYLRLEADLFGQPCGYPRIAGERAISLAFSGRFQEALTLTRRLWSVARPGSHLADLSYAEYYPTLWQANFQGTDEILLRVREERLALRQYRLAASMQFNRFIIWLCFRSDQPDLIDEIAAETETWEKMAWERAGEGTMRDRNYSVLGAYHFFRGDWEKARHGLTEYFRRYPDDDRGQRRWYATWLAYEEGDLAAMRTLMARMPPRDPRETAPAMTQLWLHCLQTTYYLEIGQPDMALAWLEAGERCMEQSGIDFFKGDLLLARCQYERFQGNPDGALKAATTALESAQRFGLVIQEMAAQRALGEVRAERGESLVALTHFDRALLLAQRCRIPFEVAHTHLCYARSLPGRADARDRLLQARERFEQLGANRCLRQAEAALTRMEAAPCAESAASAEHGLTEREIEVVRLVTQGLTDREVAARLFISPRTVDRHLRNIFMKLEVGSRSALGVLAVRYGLLE